MITRNEFIFIPSWALSELGLSGNELLVYCVIYGYSQDGKSTYKAKSDAHIARLLNCTERTVNNCVKSLISKGLISKVKSVIDGKSISEYSAIFENSEKISPDADKNSEKFSEKNSLTEKISEKISVEDENADDSESSSLVYNKYISLNTSLNNTSSIEIEAESKDLGDNLKSITSVDTEEESIDTGDKKDNKKKIPKESSESEKNFFCDAGGSDGDEKPKGSPSKTFTPECREIAQIAVSHLNEKTGFDFKPTTHSTLKHIAKRLEDGFELKDFISVIDKQYTAWVGTRQEAKLQPNILFGVKFESFLNAPVLRKPEAKKEASPLTGTEKLKEKKPAAPSVSNAAIANAEKQRVDAIAQKVLDYLNGKTGTRYQLHGTVKEYACEDLVKRIKEGYTLEHLIAVVDNMYAQWGNDAKQRKYLRPTTLFRPIHIEDYISQTPENLNATKVENTANRQQKRQCNLSELIEYPLGSGRYMPPWEYEELIAKEKK